MADKTGDVLLWTGNR